MTTRTHEQDIVLQIQRDNGVDEESIQKIKNDLEMGRTIANLQKMISVTTELLSNELYTKPAHCMLEILQNADDNLYEEGVEPELRIKLRANFMEIMCNEIGFQDAHVRAFCGIRQSTKTNQPGYIGEKGIGAKSIFKVARRVTIQSRGYAFELNRERKLGMITPIWVPDLPATPGWSTIHLELIDENQFDILKTQLAEIRSTVLLFLRKLCRLVVDDGTIFDSTKSLSGSIISLDAGIKASGARTQLVSSRYLRVAQSIAAALDDEKRHGQTSTTIILAFPLRPNDEPISAPNEMVYAFLPLRQAGFRFLLQADFLTAANREDILTDRQWNVVIRDAVSTSFVAAVDVFKATVALRYTWFRFLPREHEVAHPFFAPIVQQITTRLRVLSIIWTNVNDWRIPSKCFHFGPFKMTTTSGNDAPLLSSQYLSCAYVSTIYAPDVRNLLSSLGVRDLSYADFLEGLSRMHVQRVFTSQPASWLEDVCDKILTHGLSRGKRKNQFFQNEATLRSLPLAQRRDGSWCTCQNQLVSSLFFDASDSDFPSGLPIEVLNMENLGPRRRQLLRQLGVQDIDVKLVMEKIISLHRSNSVSVQDIHSHLQYLFKNRHSHSDKTLSTSLWLVDSMGGRVHGVDVYMESTAAVAAELRLDSLFRSFTDARLLHDSLVTEGSTTVDSRQWRIWLTLSLGVATAPRLKLSGLPSSELEFVINSNRIANTSRLLDILRVYWADMLGSLQSISGLATASMFYKYLSRVQVRCTNGQVAPLSSTYVLNESTKPFATEDLPVLLVPDIASDWSFLKHCGVTLDVNADFFLKRLRHLATRDARDVSPQQVNALYRQLESRFHEISQAIWNAFRQQSLILIGGSWQNAEHVVWDGPTILTLQHRLKPTYPHLAILFHTYLGISNAPDEVVAAELRHFSLTRARKPLVCEDVERLRQLLVFGSDTIEKVEKGFMADWTVSLRHVAILPMRMPNSKDTHLASVSSGSFYVPDPSGFLANIFATKVAFIALDPATVTRMQPLLARLGIDNRRVDKFVTREVTANGALLKHVAAKGAGNVIETSFFVHKLPFLERAYYFKMEKLLPVQSALVFNVDRLNVSYTLRGGQVFVVSSVTDCWSVIQDNKLLIFLSTDLDPQDYHNYPVAEAIILALGMRNEHVALVRSILHDSDRDTERFLRTSGIHEMQDHLRQTFEEPTETSQEEAALNVPYSEPAAMAMAPVVAARQVGLQASIPRSTRSAGLGAGEQYPSPLPQAARPAAAISAAAPEVATRQRDPQLSSALHDARTSEIGVGKGSPRWNRDAVASRSRVGADEHLGSEDRLNVYQLERSAAEEYNLQPAVDLNASVNKFLTPPLPQITPPSTIARQRSGVGVTTDQPEDPTAAHIGFLGENFVFLLLTQSLPNFGIANWTSNVRVHGGYPSFPGVEVADFAYQDVHGILTAMLFPGQPNLTGQHLEYFIEVKSTSGAASEPFHLSRRQLEWAFSMTQPEEGRASSQIYVLFRVSHIGNGGVPRLDIYADPHELLHRGALRIISNKVEVCFIGEDETSRGSD